ncbi:MAG: phosphatidylserine decarboxylase family protein [candidate division Zixibacteria bacterium]|nr:phosphatidylserine decarboxylase family protein [candidate division Zixibacteria bacterium]
MAKEGLSFILPVSIFSLVLFLLFVWLGNIISLLGAIIFFIFGMFFLFFFRDPEREVPEGENLILAPADGKVILIKPLENLEFMGGGGTLVSVFMSLFDVHVNRVPISGVVKYFKYNPGKFLPAFKDKASSENEQTELGLENEHGKVVLKQIAGIIARRIVCKLKQEDLVKAGDRFGMIKLGSRLDLFLPENVQIKVKLDHKVRAGETIIGVFQK